jgi:hypothetical protein
MEHSLYKFEQNNHLKAEFGSGSAVLDYHLHFSLVDLDAKLVRMLLPPHVVVCSEVLLAAL